MARGISGRIVLEIDPEIKKQLYSILALESLTLKEWFIVQATKAIIKNKESSEASRLLNSKKGL